MFLSLNTFSFIFQRDFMLCGLRCAVPTTPLSACLPNSRLWIFERQQHTWIAVRRKQI